jgi:amino acid permease
LLNYKIVRENKYLLLSLSFVIINILFYSAFMSNAGMVVRFKSHALFIIIIIIMFIYIKIYKKVVSEKNIDNK